MRSTILAGLVGLAGFVSAQDSTTIDASSSSIVDSIVSSSSDVASSSVVASSSDITSSSVVASSSDVTSSSIISSSSVITSSAVIATPTTSSKSSTVSSAAAVTALTVATDGSAKYTNIGAAVTAAQQSGIATVSVLAGTYTEAVMIPGTQTITIVGPTASSYAQNQVTITTSGTNGAIGFSTANSKGATFKNLNLVNSGIATAPAFYAKGMNLALYSCSLVSSGTGVFYAGYSTALIYNSYIEGTDKLFTNFPSVYVYGSTIAPLNSNALIMYAKGATVGTVNYNSTLVVDSSSVIQKAGYTNTYVYLAAPNGAYTQAVYRNTSLPSNIAPSGFYSTSCTLSANYGEFATTGAGAYSSLTAAGKTTRDNVCDRQFTAAQMASFAIDQVMGNTYPGYGTFDTTWIDSSVLSIISKSDAAQISAAPVASTSSSSSSSVMVSSSSAIVSSSSASVSSSSAVLLSTVATNATSSAVVSGTVSSTISSSSASVSSSSIVSSSSVSTSASATCAAPTPSGTLVVNLNANSSSCQYSNISAAIAALPADSKPYTILVMPGTYTEQLWITRNGKVTIIGQTTYVNDYTKNEVKVNYYNGQLTSAGKNEITPSIYAKKSNDQSGLALYNIDFTNTYPQTVNTAALAGDFYGANIAAYGCSFIGFQDTLLANKGTQVFSNCYIEGSIDFIWGFSTAYFKQCYIASNTKGGYVAAQSRPVGTVSGYVFDSCYVTYTSTYGSVFQSSYLGRPYNQYSTVVYMNSFIDKHISALGWAIWSTGAPQTSNVTFGEYNNTGDGSWQSGRASFATQFTAEQAAPYTLANWIGSTSWIDMTAYNYAPSFTIPAASAVVSSSSATASVSATSTSTGPTTTATINAHPDSGTVPPQFAVLVSPNGEVNGSYPNVTAAIASLPKDSTNQTIFIYAGTYIEQVPAINRPGAVRVIGYTTGNSGQSYKDNQVTITFARGLSVSPLPVGHSNAETSVVQTASNKISFYNINMFNTENSDGATPNYVTLAASIYGNDIGFYGCSFNGWQDTLLTGATAGYQYYESCYIGGAIDFIWGYSKAYFKGCTLGAKKAKSAIAAHSRASSTAIGGYIFDQCLFTQAPDATVDLTNTVYLGRPYSKYSLVVIKNSYIDDTINPSGWKIWSVTDPRTDFITFAEYNNVGPSNWENNAAARLAFGNATLLTSDTYPLASVMDSTSWIDMTYWNSIVTPEPAVINTTTATPVIVSGSAAYNGTTPPTGAIIVSKTAIDGVTTYDTVQAAMNAASITSKVNATIFIYPGVYEEQLIVNKSGTTIFMGYSDSTDDFNSNQVTIQQSKGISTQGTGGSNVDGATVYATGNYFYAYNINFRNNNGTQQDIASLGFAVKSSKYAFLHGCQIYGNQDTLYISGYMFAFKTYIEGNIDFIFGAGLGYFLDSTIAPNEDKIAITAAKRLTNTTQAGFVFDQCTVEPAKGYSGFTNVSLGRPWNNFANVAWVDSYFDSMIGGAGWTQWSKTSPQTDGVSYGEYHNYGPGASICNRASFSKQLSDTEVAQYLLANFFTSIAWIDFSVVDVNPFTVGIGSAQTCSATSSATVVPVVSATSSVKSSSSVISSIKSSSSVISSSLISSSSVSSSVPVVTAYATTTTTAKVTLYTTLSQADRTSTIVSVVTENNAATVTPDVVLRTTTFKATGTVTNTVTPAAATSTIRSTETAYATVYATGRSTTVKSTSITTLTTTVAANTAVVKATTTVVVDKTTTPRAVTSTVSEGGVVTSYSTIAPRGATVTSLETVSVAGTTKVTSLKAATVVVSYTSLKTTSKRTTVTATCIPTAAAAKRAFRFKREIEARAAGTTTLTSTATVTSVIKTSIITQSGAVYTTTSVSTLSQGGATTLKAVTSVVPYTTYSYKTVTATEANAAAATVTSISTITSATTVSAPVNTLTSVVYSTVRVTESQAGLVSTSYVTVSRTSVVTAAQSTVLITRSGVSTTVIRTTVPASTATVVRTTSIRGAASTVTVQPSAVTKNTTVNRVVTVYSTSTKTSSNAAACTA